MGYHVDNAVILAAGTSSRFAPLSYEMPKALIEVKGEVLIERQIRQLQETGIDEIVIVTGSRNCFGRKSGLSEAEQSCQHLCCKGLSEEHVHLFF